MSGGDVAEEDVGSVLRVRTAHEEETSFGSWTTQDPVQGSKVRQH